MPWRTACGSPSPPRAPAAPAPVAVFEVHVPDAIAVCSERRDRLAAAVVRWPVSRHSPSSAGIGARHQRVDLLRRFDVAGAVMVKDGPKAGRVADRGGDALGTGREAVPLSLVRPSSSRMRPARSVRCGTVALSSDSTITGERACRSRREPPPAASPCARRGRSPSSIAVFPSERDRHERADERERASADVGDKRRGVGRQESPVAQLGAGVAGRRHLVEHLRRRGRAAPRPRIRARPRSTERSPTRITGSRAPCAARLPTPSRAPATSRVVETSATGTSHHDS